MSMSAGVVIIIIIVFLYFFRDDIGRWLRGFMARRTEDALRRMFGMPSRKEEEKMRKRERKGSGRQRSHSAAKSTAGEEAVRNMQRYAEDVDYVEYRQFEQTEIAEEVETADKSGKKNVEIKVEEQISDAEYIEIK